MTLRNGRIHTPPQKKKPAAARRRKGKAAARGGSDDEGPGSDSDRGGRGAGATAAARRPGRELSVVEQALQKLKRNRGTKLPEKEVQERTQRLIDIMEAAAKVGGWVGGWVNGERGVINVCTMYIHTNTYMPQPNGHATNKRTGGPPGAGAGPPGPLQGVQAAGRARPAAVQAPPGRAGGQRAAPRADQGSKLRRGFSPTTSFS